jgi:hypothetical protein
LEAWGQEDEFKANLGYIVKPCLKNKKDNSTYALKTISTNTEKAFDKIPHSFMIKDLDKTGIKRLFCKLIKGISWSCGREWIERCLDQQGTIVGLLHRGLTKWVRLT